MSSFSALLGLSYLKYLFVQLQALALDEVAGRCGHLICQVPKSTQCKLQSGVYHSHHGFLLHNSQQLLLDRNHKKTQGDDKDGWWERQKKIVLIL